MKTSVIVQNLKCGGCANTITNKLSEIKNISDIHIDIEDSKISFKYIYEDDAFLVKEKLKSIGYPSIEEDNSLVSKTKSFISCATGKFS
ncbi:heavy-metal-associated domain-containing protein [Xanthomarina sp. F2636L]|uniref:heavy-metal-associated domain-containing protein n=1 Tax=Xanthomarina sp. F2636L TaxID=2996018 RepID=UPI00225E4BDF|nr:heavy metal-associated domain-containing protein [Xanthomarina sp. F2636L]MCX7550343.1 heavy metal-associated domain-containing protein [Xanthomarina sp. F2636L]